MLVLAMLPATLMLVAGTDNVCVVTNTTSSFQNGCHRGLATAESSARGQILLQGHVHRARSSPVSEMLMSASPNSSQIQRRPLAALQGGSQKVNCTGSTGPCLPYQSFAEHQLAATQNIETKRWHKTGTAVVPSGKHQQSWIEAGAQDTGTASSPEDRRWLPLELHLDGMSLEALQRQQKAEDGSALADFIIGLRSSMAEACDVTEKRIQMVSIYGRFVRSSLSRSLVDEQDDHSLQPVHSEKRGVRLTSEEPHHDRLAEEVVVRFFIKTHQEDVKNVFDTLHDALNNQSSALLTGNLSNTLQSARLTAGHEENYERLEPPTEKLSTMALPFAVSAFFTGVLIWLASW